MFRDICEAYMGVTPAHIEDLSPDQIYIMVASKAALAAWRGTVKFDIQRDRAEMVRMGIVPPETEGTGTSLVKRIRAENRRKREADKKQSKRDRRRRERQLLQEARARGEA